MELIAHGGTFHHNASRPGIIRTSMLTKRDYLLLQTASYTRMKKVLKTMPLRPAEAYMHPPCRKSLAGNLDGYGLTVSNGPWPVVESGRLIMAFGPALCSELNGVGLVGSKPHAAASSGLSNQNPTWNV